MPQSLRLEIFETPEAPEGPVLLLPEQIEDMRLAAYERGYLAGWEDAGARHASESDSRRAAIERTAERLTFTYHEARGHVLQALRPLLSAMLATVLPAATRGALVPMVVEALMPLASTTLEAPVLLRVPDGAKAQFVEAFEGLVLPPLTLVETADLAEGEAEFVFGDETTRVDLGRAIAAIAEAIDRFHQIQTEEKRRA